MAKPTRQSVQIDEAKKLEEGLSTGGLKVRQLLPTMNVMGKIEIGTTHPVVNKALDYLKVVVEFEEKVTGGKPSDLRAAAAAPQIVGVAENSAKVAVTTILEKHFDEMVSQYQAARSEAAGNRGMSFVHMPLTDIQTRMISPLDTLAATYLHARNFFNFNDNDRRDLEAAVENLTEIAKTQYKILKAEAASPGFQEKQREDALNLFFHAYTDLLRIRIAVQNAGYATAASPLNYKLHKLDIAADETAIIVGSLSGVDISPSTLKTLIQDEINYQKTQRISSALRTSEAEGSKEERERFEREIMRSIYSGIGAALDLKMPKPYKAGKMPRFVGKKTAQKLQELIEYIHVPTDKKMWSDFEEKIKKFTETKIGDVPLMQVQGGGSSGAPVTLTSSAAPNTQWTPAPVTLTATPSTVPQPISIPAAVYTPPAPEQITLSWIGNTGILGLSLNEAQSAWGSSLISTYYASDRIIARLAAKTPAYANETLMVLERLIGDAISGKDISPVLAQVQKHAGIDAFIYFMSMTNNQEPNGRADPLGTIYSKMAAGLGQGVPADYMNKFNTAVQQVRATLKQKLPATLSNAVSMRQGDIKTVYSGILQLKEDVLVLPALQDAAQKYGAESIVLIRAFTERPVVNVNQAYITRASLISTLLNGQTTTNLVLLQNTYS